MDDLKNHEAKIKVSQDFSGRTGILTQLSIEIGILLTALMGQGFQNTAIDDEAVLYVMYGFPALTLIIRMCLLQWVYDYETPKFYVMQSQRIEALEVLAGIYEEEYIDYKLKQTIEDIQEREGKTLKFKSLFGYLRRPLIIGLAMGAFQ